jgi:hypothetical protein
MGIDQFYNEAFQQTDKAFESTGNQISYTIELAGVFIRLDFAGNALVPYILPAIEHLLVEDSTVSTPYTISIWDSGSTGIHFPQSPCEIEAIQIRGELAGFLSDRFESAYFSHARMLSFVDHEKNHGVVCFVNPNEIPAFELSCPLRGLFSWILRRNNIVMVHAASVGTSNGSLLIGGNSGAGKSSTALRGLIGGLTYFGDDICAISINANLPKTHGIYCSGKVHSSDLDLFPALHASNYGHFEEEYDKEIFFFNKDFSSQLQKMGNLKAVIVPHQNPTIEIGFEPLSRANALSIICSSSKLLLPDAGNEIFRVLSSILHQVPCFRFNLGNDPSKIANSIENFLIQLTVNAK